MTTDCKGPKTVVSFARNQSFHGAKCLGAAPQLSGEVKKKKTHFTGLLVVATGLF